MPFFHAQMVAYHAHVYALWLSDLGGISIPIHQEFLIHSYNFRGFHLSMYHGWVITKPIPVMGTEVPSELLIFHCTVSNILHVSFLSCVYWEAGP